MEDFEVPKDRFLFLTNNGVPNSGLPSMIAGAAYYEYMKGVSSKTYWTSPKFDIRDEFFVVLNSYFGLAGSLQRAIPSKNEWRKAFDVCYLFQIKSTAQGAKSIDELLMNHCYADALVICRTFISRLNLLLLCSLNPSLFDQWLKNPKDERFLDGHIRNELENNGISTGSHLYELTSEIIHSQAEALSDVGYLNDGLFPEIPGARQKVFVIAKFVIATAYLVMIKMAELDYHGKQIPEELQNHRNIFDWLRESYLVHNRWDQLFTFIAEDRHWEKIGKDKHKIGGAYDLDAIQEQLEKFHKFKGQKKFLSKKYNKE